MPKVKAQEEEDMIDPQAELRVSKVIFKRKKYQNFPASLKNR